MFVAKRKMSIKAVVGANDKQLIAVHKEFHQWKTLNPQLAKTDYGFAMRHYQK